MERRPSPRTPADDAIGCVYSVVTVVGLGIASALWSFLDNLIGWWATVILAAIFMVALWLFYYQRSKMAALDKAERRKHSDDEWPE